MMKRLPVLLVAVLLTVGAAACGGAGKAPRSRNTGRAGGEVGAAASPRAARPGGYLEEDGDGDRDDEPHPANAENGDRILLSNYGSRAGPRDVDAVTALIKRYYAAAAAGDGTTACSLLSRSIAATVASDQGQSSQGRREGCAGYMSTLFKQQHQQLVADDVATMVVVSVHVKGDLGEALLGFRTVPEASMLVEREGRLWKIGSLLDGGTP
jgi:hypothetical protein